MPGTFIAAWSLMKQIILLVLSPVLLSAQHKPIPASQVPESVKASFQKMFPDARVKTWEQEKFGLYEAETKINGHPASVTFNANGLHQRTEEEVKQSELPGEVIVHAKEMFPGYSIAECQLISTPDQRKLFEVEMKKDGDRKSLIFDENNTLLRVEIDEDDDDEDQRAPAKKG